MQSTQDQPRLFRGELQALLRCPGCQDVLVPQPNGHNCPTCGVNYPEQGGVLRFVDPKNYADSFGFQWHCYPTTQLDTGEIREADQHFRMKTGLQPEELRGKLILDVGCGMGRFAEVATRWGARVIGIDLSAASEVAARNLADRDFVAMQADVFRLPFAPQSFERHLQHRRTASHAGLRGCRKDPAAISQARGDFRGMVIQRI